MLMRRIRLFAAAALLSPVLVGGAASASAQDCTPYCGEGCEGCNDDSCGSCLTDPHELFNHLAGDETIFDGLKNKKVGGMTYSVGGQLRHRYMKEFGRLRPGGGNAEYSLWRFTPYMKMQFNDYVGGFVEGIDASVNQEGANPYTPVGIDVNRMDFLRYYGELSLLNEKDSSLKYRYGRQYLKYGGQRLLSPLAWSNTFRNFEGHKILYTNGDWNVDAFMMNSVNAAAGGAGFDRVGLDTADPNRRISGLYSTYKGIEGADVDLYWLYSDVANAAAGIQDGQRHTMGTRFAGSQAIKECDTVVGTWAWDFEAAYQFGRDNGLDVSAGMTNATVGYTFNEAPWSPGVQLFYYWASGTSAGSGTNNTFYTQYPLGHAYWGQIDNFSGQNMHDVGVNLTCKPHKKLNLLFSYHHFEKANVGDSVYNIIGAPVVAPNGSTDLGDEFDIIATVPVTKNFNVQAGYFWFYYGAAAGVRPDAHQFYLQTTWSF